MKNKNKRMIEITKNNTHKMRMCEVCGTITHQRPAWVRRLINKKNILFMCNKCQEKYYRKKEVMNK